MPALPQLTRPGLVRGGQSGRSSMAGCEVRGLLKSAAASVSNETEAESAARDGPTAKMKEASALLFNRISAYSACDGSEISKKDLITAHRGDFSIFEHMDSNNDDRVTLGEWNSWIEATHKEKRAKRAGSGDKWLLTLLHTLEAGCTQHDLQQQQKELRVEAREGLSVPLQATCSWSGSFALRQPDLTDR